MHVGYRTAIRQLCIDFLYNPVGDVLGFLKMLKPVILPLHLLSLVFSEMYV